MIGRRALLLGGAGLLAGCDRIGASAPMRKILFSADAMNRHAQRLVTDRNALAREFSAADISPFFRGNGTQNPQGAYQTHAAENFANWRIEIGGLVARPQSLSMAQIRSMPARTQITRHDCVEGWSAIGRWTGVRLSRLLDLAGLRDAARYIVFRCADDMGGGVDYYESIDLVDAFHQQTIMAWALNGQILPVRNGAPLRLRVERQLGYKHAKYVRRIEAVASLDAIGLGKGGFWEDRVDYEWYAGI
jgi:DMSO/TMAO reductase YedYZ molybdopterin-dependent catalytic subunit